MIVLAWSAIDRPLLANLIEALPQLIESRQGIDTARSRFVIVSRERLPGREPVVRGHGGLQILERALVRLLPATPSAA